MSRDYAKRNVSRKKNSKSHLFLWLMLLLLFAAFIASLVMPDKYRDQVRDLLKINLIQKTLNIKPSLAIETMAKRATKKESTTKEVTTKEAVVKTVTTPKFDFYNILPQKKDNKSDKLEVAYELDIATVADFAAADRLKAELALLGFAASITPIYQNNIQKYHLSVGPYDTKESALANQKKLKTNGVKSELKKVQ